MFHARPINLNMHRDQQRLIVIGERTAVFSKFYQFRVTNLRIKMAVVLPHRKTETFRQLRSTVFINMFGTCLKVGLTKQKC